MNNLWNVKGAVQCLPLHLDKCIAFNIETTNNNLLKTITFTVNNETYFYYLRDSNNNVNHNILLWLKDIFKSNNNKISFDFLNILEVFEKDNIIINGNLYDLSVAEVLINSNPVANTFELYKRYKNIGLWNNILNVFKQQWAQLEKLQLLDLFILENNIIRIAYKMHKQGVKVDINKAYKLYDDLAKQEQILLNQIQYNTGLNIDIWQSSSIQKLLDFHNIKLNNFNFDNIKNINIQNIQLLVEARKINKLKNVFLKSYILENHHNGIINTTYQPLGTVTGRFSANNPNLQNIPAKGEFGKIIRGLFIPFNESSNWYKYDYSQIEFRFLLHYSNAFNIIEQYNKNPLLDFHDLTQQLIFTTTGLNVDRKTIKNINFGLIYGMGVKSLASNLNIEIESANNLFNVFHKSAPFIKETFNNISNKAKQDGAIKSILGRINYINENENYKSLNRLLQSSSADLLKKALYECEKAGLFNELGYPVLTVHDEVDLSVLQGKEKYLKDLKYILENSLSLKIPIIVKENQGVTWNC